MSKFEQKFVNLLERANTDDSAPSVPESPERQAMTNTLDKGITPQQYDVPAPRTSLNAEEKQRQLEELKQWISEIDNFADFLNAANSESIQTKLHSAGCDTLFEEIAGSVKKKLSRIAAELSTLGQDLKGYLISSNN